MTQTSTTSRTVSSMLMLGILLMAGCGKKGKAKHKEPETFNEFKDRVELAFDGEHKREAKEYLEKMIEAYPEDQNIGYYRVSLADMNFNEGRAQYDNNALETAYGLYKKFYKLNPSDVRAEYASYRAILSKFYQTHRIDCDTSQLEKTRRLCAKHLVREEYKVKKYHQDVKDISYTCDRKLIDKEVYIFGSYVRSGKYKSAENRLQYIKDQFLEAHQDLMPRVMYLEAKLAMKKKETGRAEKHIAALETQFPESPFATMAQDLVSRKNLFIF